MRLSDELIEQFAKATNDNDNKKDGTTAYGTVVEKDGVMYVQIDGSEILTPISTTADVIDGERVVLLIKNHAAVVTGNLTSPSARSIETSTLIQDNKQFKEDISKLKEDVSNLGMEDSDWQTAILGDNFTLYSETHSVVYRRMGLIVELRGAIKPSDTIVGSSENVLIFTLPGELSPLHEVVTRCHGGDFHSWVLSIKPNGNVCFSRYNNGSEYIDADTETWLPFQVTYFINEKEDT